MRRLTRRDFLRAALLTAGTTGLASVPRGLRADTGDWGEWPEALADGALAPGERARNVLEVFLLGGMSPWETFYAVDRPEYGQADKRMWWTFQEGPDSVAEWHAKCLSSPGPLLQDFATDSLGVQVKLGPFADPLRQRADITDRLRVHVMSHGLFPHEAAQALAMTGARLGQPRMSGVGAPVARYFGSRALGVPGLPSSYVIGEHFTQFPSTYGRHPASYRPLRLRAARLADFAQGLENLAETDARFRKGPLLDLYAQRYERRLSVPATQERVRAPAVEDLAFTIGLRDRFDLFAETLAAAELATEGGSVCGWDYPLDIGRAQLELASYLLALPNDATRHVTIVDRAFDVDVGDAYDSHQRHVEEAAARYTYFWQRLVERINAPGENDPTKIDLDQTLVVINTEFGRSPEVQEPDGRNHYPHAYVTLMFGGPVGPEQRGVVGAIDSNGAAVDALRPAATRAATLAALGVYPFAPDAYSIGDLADVGSEEDGLRKLKEVVLGVAS